MNKFHAGSSVVLAALLMAGGMAHAQTTGTTTAPAGVAAPTAGKLARADAAFLKQAAQNGHAEVESSKVALTKAVNPQVKAFAQQMVDDHTKTNSELSALAASKGVDVPTEPSLAQKAKLKLLSARDGDGFDRHYAESMGVEAHEDTIKLFKKASAEATDQEVKAFALKTLPALEHHLQMAKALHAATDKKK